MSKQINITHFQGVLGNVENSSVSQSMSLSISKNDIESLSKFLSSNDIENNDIELLKNAIKSDPTPTQAEKLGSHVNDWILKMLSKSADGSWNVGIATAGNLLAGAIATYYGI